ncbi:MAG: TrkA C-terminal domain-containing protein [Thermoleophilia bacterium]
MPEIIETRLPGVGIRHEFVTSRGERLGIITHHSGRRELIFCAACDPDVCRDVVRLEEDDVRTLSDILGQSQVVENVNAMHLSLQGLTIDWLPVTAEAPCASCTLYDVEHHDETPASIVAVVRNGKTIAAPPSSFELEPGDTAVVVGTPEGAAALAKLLLGE